MYNERETHLSISCSYTAIVRFGISTALGICFDD